MATAWHPLRLALHRPAQGFSLLEAVVAMAIAAVAFTVLFRAVGQSSKVANDVDQRIAAQQVAQSVLASASYAEELEDLQSGQDGPWQWRLHVAAVPVEWLLVGGAVDDGDDALMPPQAVAQVDIEVWSVGAAVPAATWRGYKIYSELP